MADSISFTISSSWRRNSTDAADADAAMRCQAPHARHAACGDH
jgi:hypothetical protein